MIHGIKPTVLDYLAHSQHKFYLTGSRFFGGAKADSDYDFFTQDCVEVRAELGRLGFRPEQGYEDLVTALVLKHPR